MEVLRLLSAPVAGQETIGFCCLETQYVIDFNVFKFCSPPPSTGLFSLFASLNLCGNSPTFVEEAFFWLGNKQMEELVDISQDRGPLLFCCCTVAAPLPTLTGLEYYSPKPLFSLVFLFFLRSLTQLQPLLPSAFVKDGPSTTPPTPLSLSHYLTRSLIMRSSVPLVEGWERSAQEESVWETSDTPLLFSPKRGGKKTNVRSCFAFCQHTFSFPCTSPLSLCNTLSVRWLLSLTHSNPASAGWVHWHWDHYLLPGD